MANNLSKIAPLMR